MRCVTIQIQPGRAQPTQERGYGLGFRKPQQKFLDIALDVIEQISLMSKPFRNSLPTTEKEFEKFAWQWGRALEKTRNYPDFIYYDAVDILFSESGDTKWEIQPYHFLEACKTAMVWANNHPEKRKIVQQHLQTLQERLDERYDHGRHG